MAGLDREQLEALRRQVEEDYRLDITAIERMQRRFIGQTSNPPAASFSSGNGSYSSGSNGSVTEARGAALPTLETRVQAQPDELTGSLRTMFSSHLK